MRSSFLLGRFPDDQNENGRSGVFVRHQLCLFIEPCELAVDQRFVMVIPDGCIDVVGGIDQTWHFMVVTAESGVFLEKQGCNAADSDDGTDYGEDGNAILSRNSCIRFS